MMIFFQLFHPVRMIVKGKRSTPPRRFHFVETPEGKPAAHFILEKKISGT
jgi:hypothetical protein